MCVHSLAITLCLKHVRLTDNQRVGIHPNKVVWADHERLLLPALPKEAQRLLSFPPPEILSDALIYFGLRADIVSFVAPAARVRNRYMDGLDSTIGHPDHVFRSFSRQF